MVEGMIELINSNRYGSDLEGVRKNDLIRYQDKRGWFCQQWTTDALIGAGFREGFVQLNMSFSKQGVLRGMHRQDQSKLVQVLSGKIFDAVLQPETGRWCAFVLEEGQWLFVPPQYAHGFFVMSDTALVQYAVDKPYNTALEETFSYDAWGIAWPTTIEIVTSEKDANS